MFDNLHNSGGERGAKAAAGPAALLGHGCALWHNKNNPDKIFNNQNDKISDALDYPVSKDFSE